MLNEQAQLGPDQRKNPRTGLDSNRSVRFRSVEEARSWIKRRLNGKAGSTGAGRPLDKYFVKE